jgi:hypothetical protein
MGLARSRCRIPVLALYLFQGGILLPLHHHAHADGMPAVGPSLGAGCHLGLPCSDPDHPHPAPPSDLHRRDCVACSAALRPAVALVQHPLPAPGPAGLAAELACHRPAPELFRLSPAERAPPSDLSS